MKHTLFSFLTLSALILGAQGCRTSYMQKAQTDSSSVKTEATSEKWNREIIREYLPGRIDTIHSQTNQLIQVPKIVPFPQPYYREIIRDSGEKQKQTEEKKDVQIIEKKVETEAIPAWKLIAFGAGMVIAFMIILGVLYKIAKIRILAAIPKP
jgi:hypothetical protein